MGKLFCQFQRPEKVWFHACNHIENEWNGNPKCFSHPWRSGMIKDKQGKNFYCITATRNRIYLSLRQHTQFPYHGLPAGQVSQWITDIISFRCYFFQKKSLCWVPSLFKILSRTKSQQVNMFASRLLICEMLGRCIKVRLFRTHKFQLCWVCFDIYSVSLLALQDSLRKNCPKAKSIEF